MQVRRTLKTLLKDLERHRVLRLRFLGSRGRLRPVVVVTHASFAVAQTLARLRACARRVHTRRLFLGDLAAQEALLKRFANEGLVGEGRHKAHGGVIASLKGGRGRSCRLERVGWRDLHGVFVFLKRPSRLHASSEV